MALPLYSAPFGFGALVIRNYLTGFLNSVDGLLADAKPLLKNMETNGIGLKRASFYMAYALYYEKHKRFSDAEKKYRLGIQKNSKKANNQETGGFEIFVDEDGPNSSDHNVEQNRHSKKHNMKLNQETSGFEIFVDENEANVAAHNAMCHKNNRRPPRPLCDASKHQEETDFQKPFVGGFTILPDDEEEQYWKTVDNTNSRTVQPTHNNTNSLHPVQANSGTRYLEGSHPVSSGLQEDTVIRRFVGSTIDDEPKVENACHHGLVDPTINLKEAMDDINNMFGKPLNFKGEKQSGRLMHFQMEKRLQFLVSPF
ncbi:hypothetical protein HU200_049961 [Digitaria exilis]|uniref:BUB1 N-terminal domain-containing protein n=1 Tax=Digitaria exilis TaxID=1010633 RepID=A0A835ASC5_9POAL|nr:hypothetical protein HU200_049961 [Digitaria exilis]